MLQAGREGVPLVASANNGFGSFPGYEKFEDEFSSLPFLHPEFIEQLTAHGENFVNTNDTAPKFLDSPRFRVAQTSEKDHALVEVNF